MWGQLEKADDLYNERMHIWETYYKLLKPSADKGDLALPVIPEGIVHNAHIFYIKTTSLEERTALIDYLKKRNIHAVFHYVPLHTAEAGLKYGRFSGIDECTTAESEKLLRLPMYYGLSDNEVLTVVNTIKGFFNDRYKA